MLTDFIYNCTVSLQLLLCRPLQATNKIKMQIHWLARISSMARVGCEGYTGHVPQTAGIGQPSARRCDRSGPQIRPLKNAVPEFDTRNKNISQLLLVYTISNLPTSVSFKIQAQEVNTLEGVADVKYKMQFYKSDIF